MGQEALSKIETLKDNNGCVYKGESHHGKAHGNGWMECPDPVNTLYRGEWQFGRFHGKGRYTWENGEYEGDF